MTLQPSVRRRTRLSPASFRMHSMHEFGVPIFNAYCFSRFGFHGGIREVFVVFVAAAQAV